MKNKNKDSIGLITYHSRTEWHNTVLLSIITLLLFIILLRIVFYKHHFYAYILSLPLVVLALNSGVFSIEKCPTEILPLNNPNYFMNNYIFSLTLIISATLLTVWAAGSCWAFFSVILYSLILLVGNSAQINQINNPIPTIKTESISPPVEIAPDTQGIKDDLVINGSMDIGIILGLLGVYSKDYSITQESNNISVINNKGVYVRLTKDNNSNINITVKLNDDTLSLSIKEKDRLVNYHELLLKYGEIIKQYNKL